MVKDTTASGHNESNSEQNSCLNFFFERTAHSTVPMQCDRVVVYLLE